MNWERWTWNDERHRALADAKWNASGRNASDGRTQKERVRVKNDIFTVNLLILARYRYRTVTIPWPYRFCPFPLYFRSWVNVRHRSPFYLVCGVY